MYRTEVSSSPVNYRDAQGAWQPIDTTLVASTGKGFAWQAKAVGYDAQFPGTLADGPIRVSRGGRWVGLQLDGATAKGVVDGATITHADALPGVTLVYTVLSTG
ncbi:hypothetical protein ND748_17515 [Frankia sp. AiPs1]|uniref:hypothetical protein n=1 Tax=Frankia sp. AiPs1 TaxID=573493 RepID=UPI002044CCEA|nr:hypothetical protein [Frankia sp. AiPs1]MCM3923452.1 hypothetical protein [Frankia sp. AiPs1]